MNCPQCGTENPEGANFCLNCGADLALVCSRCGATLPPQARFCFICGARLGAAAPMAPQAPANRLERLVPQEFAARLKATRGQVGRERRTVTILFSDVTGSTAIAEELDPEEWTEIMEGAFDVLIEPVYRYEGTVARLLGDAVLAFFGAPIAHEDDPERACRAALDIISGIQRYAARLERERSLLGFSVRVGVNTGLVVVGKVGSDLRVEYTVMGDAVNVAARLEQNAPPGGILISHDTYRHVRGVFDVLVQEPLTVKGKAEPVQTYLVQRAKPRAFRKPVRGVEGIETRMVGREAELKRLQEGFYTAMEDSELQVLTIAGEAGVGKSRLLHEFDLWSELLSEQFYYFKGRASAEMQNLPYSLIRDLLAFRFQIQDSDLPATVLEKLAGGVGAAVREDESSHKEPQVTSRAHFLGRLIGFEIGDSPYLAGMEDDAEKVRNQALGYLSDYFRGMAAQLPVLILLEDLHWADDSSLNALNHVSLTLTDQPVMIVGAARPVLFERRPHWGEGQSFHTRLELQRLSKWDSRRLVAEILQKVDHVPDTLRDLVVSGAEGNPFFIEELIKMLVEDGVILKGEEQWRLELSRLAEIRVPPTLTGVLQARLDRLPVEERTILQQASVVGRLFWDRAVARINESVREGIEATEVVDKLSALRVREMVFQRETSAFVDAQEYIFKHALLQEVTYESVLKKVRRIYHGLVADWLLEQGGERVVEYTGLIADHLEMAGRTAEAVDYLLQAGDRSRALYAHQEAIGAYERALAVLKDQGHTELAARTLLKLGLVYMAAFEPEKAQRVYDEAFSLWKPFQSRKELVASPVAPAVLRVAVGEPVSLDPGKAYDSDSFFLQTQLFEGLVEIDVDQNVLPAIAARWEVTDGGTKYDFYLREEARWSDGTPVTASHFEYAWKRNLNPVTNAPAAHLLYDIQNARAYREGEIDDPELVGVKALNDFTLEIRLEGPKAYLPYLLAHPITYPLPDWVTEAHQEAWTIPGEIVTNGAYAVEEWQQGERLVFKRNPYYGGHFPGNAERVECLVFTEYGLALQAYATHRVDVVGMPTAAAEILAQARAAHREELIFTPMLNTNYLIFRTDRPPFDDVRVRKAFIHAVDRKALIGRLSGGGHLPATGGFVPPEMPGHSPGIGLAHDPEAAARLLAEAGYPGGHGLPTITWLHTHGLSDGSVIPLFQEAWRQNLHVTVEVTTLAWEPFLTRIENDPPHLMLGGWIADYPDPDNFLRVVFHTAEGINEPHWRNNRFEELVDTAAQTTDQARRMALYREADQILVAEEAVIMPFSYGREPILVKPWVSHFSRQASYSRHLKNITLEEKKRRNYQGEGC